MGAPHYKDQIIFFGRNSGLIIEVLLYTTF